MAETKLVVDDLHLAFAAEAGRPLPVLAGVSFDIAPGEFVSVIGPSGCGKSTLFNVVAGLLRPDAGRVLVDGADATGRTEPFAYMPQQDLLFPWRNVLDNAALGLQVAGMRRRAARERARALFAPFGLAGFEDARPFELSGGMRQRVMIALALSCDPNVLIADEPTTALDVTVQAQILQRIGQLRDETGAGVILVTHDLGVVAEIADRVAVMYAGRIVEEGSLDDIFYDPQHPYTWGLLGSIMRVDRERRARLPAIAGLPPSLVHRPQGCHFRPRCPHEFDRCPETPLLESRVAGTAQHRDRCWLTPEDKRARREVRAGELGLDPKAGVDFG